MLVIDHALAATVWTGADLVLDLGVLPGALRERSAEHIPDFEAIFESLGLTALAIQVITGLWQDRIFLPGVHGLFDPARPIGVPAEQARLQLIPNLTDTNLSNLAWHIRAITALAIAFVVMGAVIRPDGVPDFGSGPDG